MKKKCVKMLPFRRTLGQIKGISRWGVFPRQTVGLSDMKHPRANLLSSLRAIVFPASGRFDLERTLQSNPG
jgi:hypothetical protein